MNTTIKNNEQVIKDLVKAGVVDPHWVRDIEIYKKFRNKKCGKMQAYQDLAVEYRISVERIMQIIKRMR